MAVAITSKTTVVIVTSASFQLSQNIAATIPPTMKRSPITATTPWAKSSFSTATSCVTRVRMRPTGRVSK